MNFFDKLPVECLSIILSFTSPLDTCRSCLISTTFRSSAESDMVWESFLPSDYTELLSRSSSSDRLRNISTCSYTSSSKKDIFFRLCSSIYLDGGQKIFALDRTNGLKSYIISSRELKIMWADIPTYWCWKSIPQSRFTEVAELITTSWLEIHGMIDSKTLSPNTVYGAFLIYRATERAYGLETMPMEGSVYGEQESSDMILNRRTMVHLSWNQRSESCLAVAIKEEDQEYSSSNREAYSSPRLREDGYWMEVKLGWFFVNRNDDCMIGMSLKEVKGHHLKGGVIVEGIEVRPVGQTLT